MSTKTTGISNLMQFSLFIIVGVIFTVVLLLLEFPKWLIYVIILGFSLSVFTIRPMFLMYKSKSLPAIDRYVIKNRKKALFGYAYALAYRDNQAIEDSLNDILRKYKQTEMQITYGANLALHQKDSDVIIEYAEKMTRKDFKEYFLGAAYLIKGDEKLSGKYLAELTTPWMIHSLKASTALLHKDQMTFRQEADKAISSATGLQKYTLHYMMKRMEVTFHKRSVNHVKRPTNKGEKIS